MAKSKVAELEKGNDNGLEKENAELKSKVAELEKQLKIAMSKNNVSVAGGSVRVNDVVRRVEREKEQELNKTGKN